MMMKVINNWCLVPTSEFTARPRERGVQGWAGALDVREPERASRLAVCSAISCSNKTEVKTSAFRNSWDLTVSQMSLEGKQRCVMRKMSLHQGASAPPPPLLLSHSLSAACVCPFRCPHTLSASQSQVCGGRGRRGLGRMSGHWGILLFTWAQRRPQWGRGRRRTGGKRSLASREQVRRAPPAPMALDNMWDS